MQPSSTTRLNFLLSTPTVFIFSAAHAHIPNFNANFRNCLHTIPLFQGRHSNKRFITCEPQPNSNDKGTIFLPRKLLKSCPACVPKGNRNDTCLTFLKHASLNDLLFRLQPPANVDPLQYCRFRDSDEIQCRTQLAGKTRKVRFVSQAVHN